MLSATRHGWNLGRKKLEIHGTGFVGLKAQGATYVIILIITRAQAPK
jgi:hypothetical protein